MLFKNLVHITNMHIHNMPQTFQSQIKRIQKRTVMLVQYTQIALNLHI